MIVRARKSSILPSTVCLLNANCAETRKTYRAVLSEPKIMFPEGTAPPQDTSNVAEVAETPKDDKDVPQKRIRDDGVGESGAANPSVAQSKKKKRKPNQEGSKAVP
jgi:ribonuclease P/MRP protein subunit RPP1